MNEIVINHGDYLCDFDIEDLKSWIEANPDHGFAQIVSSYLARIAEAEEEKRRKKEEDEFPF